MLHRVHLDEALHQQRDVAGALAQRRHDDGIGVQAVVQVGAEAALLRGLLQVDVGRDDEPDVDLAGGDVADALELALLQHAQQLRLGAGGQLGDLVEEQRAAVGPLEAARPGTAGAGERTAFDAEQLRLDQVLGNRGAVDGHERTLRARAELMDTAAEHLLADAGFPEQHHRDLAGSDLVDHLARTLERLAAADELLVPALRLQRVAQVLDLRLQLQQPVGEAVLAEVAHVLVGVRPVLLPLADDPAVRIALGAAFNLAVQHRSCRTIPRYNRLAYPICIQQAGDGIDAHSARGGSSAS